MTKINFAVFLGPPSGGPSLYVGFPYGPEQLGDLF